VISAVRERVPAGLVLETGAAERGEVELERGILSLIARNNSTHLPLRSVACCGLWSAMRRGGGRFLGRD
jgi:hypothetical protein